MTARVLIAGAGGMLGTALQRVLTERGAPFSAPPESDFDITDPEAVSRVVHGFAVSHAQGGHGLLVNAAAYTNVEAAEDNPDTAYRVNEHGARVLADTAREAGLGFVHVSTDFVFDGSKDGPYVESDTPNPLSVYGASKLAGEQAVIKVCPDALIVRTAWVFGSGGANFPNKILALARERDRLRVVTDEIGSPTYTVDLAKGLLGLADAGASGLYHLVGGGSCSRFDLAAETLRFAGFATALDPVTADAFPTKAARPRNSVLDCGKAASLGIIMPDWHDGLARFLGELRQDEQLMRAPEGGPS